MPSTDLQVLRHEIFKHLQAGKQASNLALAKFMLENIGKGFLSKCVDGEEKDAGLKELQGALATLGERIQTALPKRSFASTGGLSLETPLATLDPEVDLSSFAKSSLPSHSSMSALPHNLLRLARPQLPNVSTTGPSQNSVTMPLAINFTADPHVLRPRSRPTQMWNDAVNSTPPKDKGRCGQNVKFDLEQRGVGEGRGVYRFGPQRASLVNASKTVTEKDQVESDVGTDDDDGDDDNEDNKNENENENDNDEKVVRKAGGKRPTHPIVTKVGVDMCGACQKGKEPNGDSVKVCEGPPGWACNRCSRTKARCDRNNPALRKRGRVIRNNSEPIGPSQMTPASPNEAESMDKKQRQKKPKQMTEKTTGEADTRPREKRQQDEGELDPQTSKRSWKRQRKAEEDRQGRQLIETAAARLGVITMAIHGMQRDLNLISNEVRLWSDDVKLAYHGISVTTPP